MVVVEEVPIESIALGGDINTTMISNMVSKAITGIVFFGVVHHICDTIQHRIKNEFCFPDC